jgi:hypothetical protein
MDLPTVLYRCPGPHSRAGGTYDFLGVETEENYEAAIAKGWQLTMPDAIAAFEGKVAAVKAEVEAEFEPVKTEPEAPAEAETPAEPPAPVKAKPGPKPKARG